MPGLHQRARPVGEHLQPGQRDQQEPAGQQRPHRHAAARRAVTAEDPAQDGGGDQQAGGHPDHQRVPQRDRPALGPGVQREHVPEQHPQGQQRHGGGDGPAVPAVQPLQAEQPQPRGGGLSACGARRCWTRYIAESTTPGGHARQPQQEQRGVQEHPPADGTVVRGAWGRVRAGRSPATSPNTTGQRNSPTAARLSKPVESMWKATATHASTSSQSRGPLSTGSIPVERGSLEQEPRLREQPRRRRTPRRRSATAAPATRPPPRRPRRRRRNSRGSRRRTRSPWRRDCTAGPAGESNQAESRPWLGLVRPPHRTSPSRPYSSIFLCSVLRLMPNRPAAFVCTPWQARTHLQHRLPLDPGQHDRQHLFRTGPAGQFHADQPLRQVFGRIARGPREPQRGADAADVLGQQFLVDHRAVGEDHGPLDIILQLPHVARPRVVLEQPQDPPGRASPPRGRSACSRRSGNALRVWPRPRRGPAAGAGRS